MHMYICYGVMISFNFTNPIQKIYFCANSYKNDIHNSINVFSVLSLGRILISDLVVDNLFMYSLSDIILLYLMCIFYNLKGALHEISSLL